jgi:hypothetical protein
MDANCDLSETVEVGAIGFELLLTGCTLLFLNPIVQNELPLPEKSWMASFW